MAMSLWPRFLAHPVISVYAFIKINTEVHLRQPGWANKTAAEHIAHLRVG